MTKTTYPPLYKSSKHGELQVWEIWVEGPDIYTKWGKLGGNLQTSAPTTAVGKNSGKTNATTAEAQAIIEAEAEWKKKAKHGYSISATLASADDSDSARGGCWPMLAKKYVEDGDKIIFPCFGQPKLDGRRCIASVKAGKATLWSRKRESINSMPHIVKALDDLKRTADITYDGELYVHGTSVDFEELSHLISNSEPVEGHEQMHYHIYDIVADAEFEVRSAGLQHLRKLLPKDSPIKIVETVIIKDAVEALAYFKKCRADGYEGAMLRNMKGKYLSHPTGRSDDLQKMKEFDSTEFKVISIKEGVGKLKGCAVFTCSVNDTTFDVKMKGTLESLRKYVIDPTLAVGRMLEVQFQGYTKYGTPRFPVGLRFRDDL